jgi:cytochrome c553
MHRIIYVTATALLIATGAGNAWAGDPRAGEQKMEACIACHGEQGVGELSEYPILAGQHESYLYQALKAYKSGERDNAIMSGQVAPLSDQDMRDLAAYYAAQNHDDGVFQTNIRRRSAID